MREIIIILILAMNTYLIVSKPQVAIVEDRYLSTKYMIWGIKGHVEEKGGVYYVHGKIKDFQPYFKNIELKEAHND